MIGKMKGDILNIKSKSAPTSGNESSMSRGRNIKSSVTLFGRSGASFSKSAPGGSSVIKTTGGKK